MKNLLKLTGSLIVAIVLNSCTVSKEAGSIKKKINGNWMLETITTEGINGKVTASIFNEASFTCFVGSSWNFMSGNSLGNYNINANGSLCNALNRTIRWSIYEPKGGEKQFQFKRLDEKKNPMDNGDGFRLEISQLTNTTMQLKSHILFEGNPAGYVYNFVKK